MVLYERPPGLTSPWRSGACDHVPPDGAAGMADAELGGKLFGDPVLPPLGMVGRDPLDEVDVLPRNPWAARL